jgi:hypothetical protein
MMDETSLDEFEVAGTQLFRLLGVVNGMTEYIPLTFEKFFFSVTQNLLHSCLIQYKWCMKRLNGCQYIQDFLEMDECERDMEIYIDCYDFKKILRVQKKNYLHQYENIKEFLFADEFGIVEVQRVKKE